MPHLDNRWRFDSPGRIEQDVEAGFLDLINRICAQGNRQNILEHFKSTLIVAQDKSHRASYVTEDDAADSINQTRAADRAGSNRA
jgi:hypothetical protein